MTKEEFEELFQEYVAQISLPAGLRPALKDFFFSQYRAEEPLRASPQEVREWLQRTTIRFFKTHGRASGIYPILIFRADFFCGAITLGIPVLNLPDPETLDRFEKSFNEVPKLIVDFFWEKGVDLLQLWGIRPDNIERFRRILRDWDFSGEED